MAALMRATASRIPVSNSGSCRCAEVGREEAAGASGSAEAAVEQYAGGDGLDPELGRQLVAAAM